MPQIFAYGMHFFNYIFLFVSFIFADKYSCTMFEHRFQQSKRSEGKIDRYFCYFLIMFLFVLLISHPHCDECGEASLAVVL